MARLSWQFLSTINASLVLAVRRSRADRKRMNVRQHRENNVTLMLVSVVAVFIVCQVRQYVTAVLCLNHLRQRLGYVIGAFCLMIIFIHQHNVVDNKTKNI